MGRVLGNTMLVAGFGLLLMGLSVPVAWSLYVGDVTDFAQTRADPDALRNGLVVFYVIAVASPALAGLGFVAAGWSVRGVVDAEHHIQNAGDHLGEFTRAEQERAKRFERIYGQMHEQVLALREFFQRAYVMAPGPSGTLVKAPVNIGPSRIVDHEGIDGLIPPTLPLTAMEAMPAQERDTLQRLGIRTLRELALADPHELAERTGIAEGRLYKCARAARLFAIDPIPPHDIRRLVEVGVTSVADLASRDAESLQRAMADADAAGDGPTSLEIQDWIRKARLLVERVERERAPGAAQASPVEADAPRARTFGK